MSSNIAFCGVSETIDKSREILKTLQEKYKIPGLSVGISVNGNVLWQEGMGYKDLETRTSCTADTIMKIASISKTFCSVLLAREVQQGRIDLDADIRIYLPELPLFMWQSEEVHVTCRQLASHKAGIRGYRAASNEHGFEEYAISDYFPDVQSTLKLFINDPLTCKPGDSFNYSNHGYSLLSRVIEATSQQPLPSLLHALFHSFNLTNTFIEAMPTKPPTTSYYQAKGDDISKVEALQSSFKVAAAGLLSSVPDLLSFARYFLAPCHGDLDASFVSRDVIQLMWKGEEGSQVSWWRDGSYGLGWQLVPQAGVTHVGHTGRTVGGSSVLLISLPEKAAPLQVAVVVLCNMGGLALGEVALQLSALFRRLEPQCRSSDAVCI